jgi:ABC-type nitrate/sulfonate/bicarbonate transport system ATPase subunit
MPWLNVHDNVNFGLVLLGATRERRESVASQLLIALDLMHVEKRYPHQLTREQTMRASIAQALALEPELVVLDDPFALLSDVDSKSLQDLLLRLWKQTGTAIVMTTSAAREVALLADRILVLSEQPGTVANEVINRLKRPRDMREPEFFKLEDRLERLIKGSK